jgi:hypothetical protein
LKQAWQKCSLNGHIQDLISPENKNPLFDHPMNISPKFGSNLFCGFRKKDEHVKFPKGPMLNKVELWRPSKIFFVFGADRKSNMAARAHNVF